MGKSAVIYPENSTFSAKNFKSFVFQLPEKNLLKSVSTKWGVRGPRNFFWEKCPTRNLSTFFDLSETFLFVKWQVIELGRLMCEREVNCLFLMLFCARYTSKFGVFFRSFQIHIYEIFPHLGNRQVTFQTLTKWPFLFKVQNKLAIRS